MEIADKHIEVLKKALACYSARNPKLVDELKGVKQALDGGSEEIVPASETPAMAETMDANTNERIQRHIRPKTFVPRQMNIAKRVTPRKTGNSSPTRGNGIQKPVVSHGIGHRPTPIESKVHHVLIFLRSALPLQGKTLKDAVELYPQKDFLLQVAEHMLATSMDGWKPTKNKKMFINESFNHLADPKLWDLNKGRLVPKGKKHSVRFDTDWLLDIIDYAK